MSNIPVWRVSIIFFGWVTSMLNVWVSARRVTALYHQQRFVSEMLEQYFGRRIIPEEEQCFANIRAQGRSEDWRWRY